ncbi:MAG: hypothetical protein AAF583_15460 [Pseudomonadota bacterium]
MDYAIGAAFGLVFLLVYGRLSRARLADAAYTVFAIMLAIYVGAHLVTSGFDRVVYEAVGASLAIGVAMFFREKWHLGLGLLILSHGAYDFFFGHHSGIVDWYPPVCVGFNVLVGLTLTAIFRWPGKGIYPQNVTSSETPKVRGC